MRPPQMKTGRDEPGAMTALCVCSGGHVDTMMAALLGNYDFLHFLYILHIWKKNTSVSLKIHKSVRFLSVSNDLVQLYVGVWWQGKVS